MIVPSFDSFTTGEKVTAAKLNKNIRDGGNFFRSVPSCSLYLGTAYNLASSTGVTTVPMDAVYSDNDSMTGSTGIYIRTPGLYLVSGNVTFPSNATGYRIGLLQGPANIGICRAAQAPVPGAYTSLPLSAVWRFAAGDSLTLGAVQNSGSTLAVTAGQQYTFLNAVWIGV